MHPINRINNSECRGTYQVETIVQRSELVRGLFPCKMDEEVWSSCG